MGKCFAGFLWLLCRNPRPKLHWTFQFSEYYMRTHSEIFTGLSICANSAMLVPCNITLYGIMRELRWQSLASLLPRHVQIRAMMISLYPDPRVWCLSPPTFHLLSDNLLPISPCLPSMQCPIWTILCLHHYRDSALKCECRALVLAAYAPPFFLPQSSLLSTLYLDPDYDATQR